MAEDHDPGQHLMPCPGCRALTATVIGVSSDMRVVTLQCATCQQQFWMPFPPTPARHVTD